MTTNEFVAKNLGADSERGVLWLNERRQIETGRMLGHRYEALRVRYWYHGGRTVWVLDEIGKEMPITIGVAIENARVTDVVILTYRESRGGEVRHPFFTSQFAGAALTTDLLLDRPVDGISGATLSFHAVRNIVRFALYLHDETMPSTESQRDD